MEILDPYDKYMGMAFCVLLAILLNLKAISIVQDKNEDDIDWWDYLIPGASFKSLCFKEYFWPLNPFYFGKGIYVCINVILSILCLLLFLQVVL